MGPFKERKSSVHPRGCLQKFAISLLLQQAENRSEQRCAGFSTMELSTALTVKPVDAHHKVNPVVKLLVVLFRREVG